MQLLDLLASRLGPREGEPVEIGSGTTNHNFKVRFGGSDYVLRLPGRNTELLGINRGAEAQAAELAANLGIGPEVVASIAQPRALVTRFVPGRVMTPDDLRGNFGEVGRALRRFHDCGEHLRTEFDVPRVTQAYADTAAQHGVELPDYQWALDHARGQQARLKGAEHEPVPCHNDLSPRNLIHEGHSVRFVDWEYAGMGNRYFDLGDLAAKNGFAEMHEELLLQAYWDEPATLERLSALRAMRFLSDLREAMWGLVQSAISPVAFDFGSYAARHLARLERARMI